MFSSAVVDQAVLSAANLLVGVLLIRRSTDLEYGWYVLVWNALLLLTALQNAFIGPPMVVRMSQLDAAGRGDLTASLFQEQRRLYFAVAAIAAIVIGFGAQAGWMGGNIMWILLTGVVAALCSLHREMLRLVLHAYRRPEAVLGADIPYVILLISGAALATITPMPAAATVSALGLAAAVGFWLLRRRVLGSHAWTPGGAPGILRSIAPMGLWSASGAGIHWTFGQGYSYLVAGVLSVEAVAAIAAARLLMMPINLLSSGIRSLMLPLTSGWLHAHGAPTVIRRLTLFAAGMATISLCYFAVMWLLRDWIFGTVLNKHFDSRDPLLLMWSAIFLLTVIRDQIVYLLAARERFRIMAGLTLGSAVLSILISYWGMLQYGQVGALLGMLVGEAVSLTGTIVLIMRESRIRQESLATA
ncbi:MAG: capsular biosynthesis protein [Pseudomonadota bacterium]|nr:capsular biosynthesis protein [Pseudomonadota bacterium]